MSCSAGRDRERRPRAPVHERVEGEGVVGAGREAEARASCALPARRSRAPSTPRPAPRRPRRSARRLRSGLLDLVGDDAQLERGHALVHARPPSTACPSIASTSTAAVPPTCALASFRSGAPVRRAARAGQPPAGRASGAIGLAVAVAVDGLECRAPIGERRDPRAAPRACDPHVQDGRSAALGDGVLGCTCRRPSARCRRPACALPQRRRAPSP